MTYKLRLITSSIGWGGLERNLLVMAQWMTQAGHEVSYAAVEGSPSWNHAPSFGVTPEAIPHHPRRATVLDVRRWKQLAREADLVWIRAPRDLDVASRACRQTGIPLLVQQAMQISKPKTLWWHKRRYSTVNTWVSGLESLRAETLSNTPLQAPQSHVLPLPLAPRWFDTSRMGTLSTRRHLGLIVPDGATLVGTVGRLDPGKGQRTALRALAQLPDHVHWLFVGDNTANNGVDEASYLKHLATELGVADRVHWLEGRDDVLPVYDALDVFAMTSHAETIGTVTLEAMARQVPVVGSLAGGTPELLDGGRGIGFESRDVRDLARAVQEVLAMDDSAKAKMCDAAKKHAMKSHPDALIPAWNDLLRQTIQSARTM
ncbi:MAG: glycosyltransferase family 4 protein [Flavobacteriales bacterium]